MCGRSCVRGFFYLLSCRGAELVPLPLSRAGKPEHGRGWAAPGRGLTGALMGGRRSPNGDRARRAHRHPPPPAPTAASARGGRTGARRLSAPRPHRPGARGRVRVRRVRVPRPTATRGESEPRPPPGPQGDLGDLGPRAAGSPAFPARFPRAPAEAFLLWWGLQLNLDQRRLFFDGGGVRGRGEGGEARK